MRRITILYPSVGEYTTMHKGLRIINQVPVVVSVTTLFISCGFCGESTSLPL